VDSIDGLSPGDFHRQKTTSRSRAEPLAPSPDLRLPAPALFFDRCAPLPSCGKPITRQSATIVAARLSLTPDDRVMDQAPIVRGRKRRI